MIHSIEGYIVRSPHDGWLSYTVCSTPEGAIEKLLAERDTTWDNMESKGYQVYNFYVHENNFRKYQVATPKSLPHDPKID